MLGIRLNADSECPMPGYYRLKTDCTKFYRCSEHPSGVPGQTYMSRAEFNCPPGTIFDESLSSCNHIIFVHNFPAGCNVVSSSVGSGGSGDNSISTTSTSTASPPSSISTSAPSQTTEIVEPPRNTLKPPERNQLNPLVPGGAQQQQRPPMFPTASADPQRLPIFPSEHLPATPGNQQHFPEISVPGFPGSQGEHSSIMPMVPDFPNLNIPQLHFPGLTMSPNDLLEVNNLPNKQSSKQQSSSLPFEQNLQSLASASAPTASVTITAQHMNGQKENQLPGWIIPNQFTLDNTPEKPTSSNNEGGGWIVPDGFPTFYSAFGGSPFLYSAHSLRPSPLIFF